VIFDLLAKLIVFGGMMYAMFLIVRWLLGH